MGCAPSSLATERIDLPAMTLIALVLVAGAYLLGSVNSAVLTARSRGVDIRAAGSGNPGASNIYRTLGTGPAILVYLLDLLKGCIPALGGMLLGGPAWAAAAGLAAVVGHCYPVFFRFRGGKGVATGGGVLLVTAPLVMAAAVAAYAVLALWLRVSAVGSLAAAALVMPGLLLVGVRGWGLTWFGLMLVLILWRHRSNLSRLRAGEENRV